MTFSYKNLKKTVNNDRKLVKKFGPKRARKIKQRLDSIQAAENLEELRNVPGKFHELTGDRKGKWACDLDHPYRMIFVPHENPIPTDEHGQYLWNEIKGMDIVEITDYH